VMEMAARELRLRHGDFVIVPYHVSRVANSSGKYISDQERRQAMHAGHSETALMLALAPDTVHMERAVANFPPEFPSKVLSADGRPACAWTARDFGPSGVIGDPLQATREQGLDILDTLSASWVQAITDLFHMRWVEREVGSWGYGHQQGHIEQAAALS
jgi:creatinine amidohydrolase